MTTTETVRVKLTTDQLAAYSDTMSVKVLAIEALREKKKRDAAATQADIDQLLDELNQIAKAVQEGEEEKAQRELFVDEEQARAALGEVAKRACSPRDATTCPVHGNCTCPEPERFPGLRCAYCDGVATCIGIDRKDGLALAPSCSACCDHVQDEGTETDPNPVKCRPVTPEDQPPVPEPSSDMHEIDCPLHGVESQHGKAVISEGFATVAAALSGNPTPAERAECKRQAAYDAGAVPGSVALVDCSCPMCAAVGATPPSPAAAAPEPIPSAAADVEEMFGPPDEPSEGGGA
jgi:hypothetical protein